MLTSLRGVFVWLLESQIYTINITHLFSETKNNNIMISLHFASYAFFILAVVLTDSIYYI